MTPPAAIAQGPHQAVAAYLYSASLTDPLLPQAVWGWEVDPLYADYLLPDAPAERPQLQALLQRHRQQPWAYVLLRSLAELGDSLAAVGQVLDQLQGPETTVVAVDPPYCSRGTAPADWLTLADAIQAHQRSRRLALGHAKNRLSRLPPPGRAPFGYRRGQGRYLIDRAAAPLVKALVEQFLLYGSLRGAVRYLERQYGKSIAVATGRRWLTHPAYRGDLAYRDGQVIPDTHAPLISRAEAAQIDRLLRRNRQLPPRTAGAPRSLAGLVTCQPCGQTLTITQVRQRHTTYCYLRSTACPRQPQCPGLRYEAVLQAVVERICQDLPAAAQAMTQGASSPLPDYAQRIAAGEAALAQLPTLVAEGILDAHTADVRRYRLLADQAALRQAQAQLPPVNLQELSQSVALPQFWLDLSEAERRFFFREFLRGVRLRRGQPWSVELDLIFLPPAPAESTTQSGRNSDRR